MDYTCAIRPRLGQSTLHQTETPLNGWQERTREDLDADSEMLRCYVIAVAMG